MRRSGRDALRLALAFGLAVACAASSGTGHDTATDPLVIDPGTFAEMPAETLFGRAAARTIGTRTLGELRWMREPMGWPDGAGGFVFCEWVWTARRARERMGVGGGLL